MTVQELIDTLSEYNPHLQVGIIDPYNEFETQIERVYEYIIPDSPEDNTVVYIEEGQLL